MKGFFSVKKISMTINAKKLKFCAYTIMLRSFSRPGITAITAFSLVSSPVAEADEFTKKSFTKENVLKVSKISSTVGEGEVLFEQGDTPGTLQMTFRGVSIKTVKGKACFACAKTIKIAPNIKIDTSFFLDTGTIDREKIGEIFNVEDMTLTGTLSEKADEIIESGPQGTTLQKVEKGFLLIEGEAYLLQSKDRARKK
jgi:hypothetical protein